MHGPLIAERGAGITLLDASRGRASIKNKVVDSEQGIQIALDRLLHRAD